MPNLVLALPNEQATVCPQVLEQVVLAHRLPPSCDRPSGMFAEHYHPLLAAKALPSFQSPPKVRGLRTLYATDDRTNASHSSTVTTLEGHAPSCP